MPTKENLNTKYNIQDNIHIAEFSPFSSPYGYKDFSKIANSVKEFVYIQPINPIALSSTIRYQIPKRQTFLGSFQVESVYSAVTANGGGTARMVDYAGFRQFDKITCRYGANLLQEIDWRTLHILHSKFKPLYRQQAEMQLVGGGLSIAEREAKAAAAQTFITDVPAFWTHHPSLFMITEGLSYLLDIQCTMCSPGALTQGTSGTTPTVTLTDQKLRCKLIHVEDEERDYHIDRTIQGGGVIYAIRDFEQQNDNILNAGATTYRIKINNLKGPFSEIRFCVRDYSSTNSDGLVGNKPFEHKPVVSWQLVSAGLTILDLITSAENLLVDDIMEHSAPAGTLYYGGGQSLDVEDFINSVGHDNMGGYTAPELVINFAADPGQSIVDIWGLTLNTVQHNKGDILKNFL